MHISFINYSIELQSWEDKQSMMLFLTTCENGHLLFEEEYQQQFHSVTVFLDHSRSNRLGIGVCAEKHGLVPQLLLQPEHSRLVLGFNSVIVGIRVPVGELDFRLNLDSLFYSFWPLYDKNILLVIHEIGVLALSPSGQILWSFSRDVITKVDVIEDRIQLEFIDSPSINLNVVNGSVEL
ncbi:MAG: hypothetical protein KatS3mg057_1035 [Herpetosiphonaceae bacterium]|nr:MAG: hypothetical protein KatS3mg057_1035 [Herpetosiphonaceae bacterium]